ncbi:hypothetical protein AVEN_153900-1 [Araneus ventricosus]|uniref:Uncharacterized protein n=1 Tax=Araneus ventricosus TaxID=182803 RepID=A0A4Y2WG23_ARAVE|nr:hypothetical protein AVEN_153900-1 [Araneus ventricosus]
MSETAEQAQYIVDAIRDEDTSQHATRLMDAKDLKSAALAYSMKYEAAENCQTYRNEPEGQIASSLDPKDCKNMTSKLASQGTHGKCRCVEDPVKRVANIAMNAEKVRNGN